MSVRFLVLIFIVLVFASQYGFSFERGAANTAAGLAFKGMGGGLNQAQNFVVRVQAVLVYAFIIYLIGRAPLRQLRRLASCRLLILFVPWIFASSTWSESPRHTFIAALLIFIDIMFAAYLVENLAPADFLSLLAIAGVVAALSSVLLIAFLPQYGIQSRGDAYEGAWQGIFGSKNFIGEELTYLVLPCLFLDLRGTLWKIARTAYILATLFITVMSRSAGSLAILLASLLFVAAVKLISRAKSKDATVFVVIASVLTAFGLAAGFEFRSQILSLFGRDATLSGRTLIWGALSISLTRSPLIGYGYDAFFTSPQAAYVASVVGNTQVNYAENGVFDMALGIGLVGTMVYLLVYLFAIRDAVFCVRRHPSNIVMLYTTILFVVTLSNVAAGYVLAYTNLQTLLPFVAYLGLRREAMAIRKIRPSRAWHD